MTKLTSLHKQLLIVVAAVLFLTFFFFQKGYQHKPSYLSGDEPHYIMLTDSFVKDGEFNLRNDYQQHRALQYYPWSDLVPHLSPLRRDHSKSEWYSIHNIGLPLLMAVPYRLLNVPAARAWVIVLQFSSVLIFYAILKKYIKSRGQQLVGLALFLTCPLLWQNLGALFPDLITVNLWGLAILLFGRRDRLSNLLMVGVLLLSALVHTKGLALIAPAVFLHLLWLLRANKLLSLVKQYAAAIGLLAVGGLAYVMFLHRHYGVINPVAVYGGKGSQLFAANPFDNTVAILMDRSKGLLVYFPLLAVAGPYVARSVGQLATFVRKIWRRKYKLNENNYAITGALTGLVILLVTQIGFLDWSGSTAPNGRYMLAPVFAIIFLVAKYVDIDNIMERTVLGMIAIIGLATSWLSITTLQNYMTTGTNSVFVSHFQPLMHLPLFNLTATDRSVAAIDRGVKLMLIILVLNIVLIIVYRYHYRLTLEKRR